MMQKHCMNGLTDNVDSAKAEGQVGNTARNLNMRAKLLDSLGGLDEVNTIVCMLLHARTNGEDIGIEDDVFWWEVYFGTDQNIIRALANPHLFFLSGCLTLLIEGHDHYCSTMLAYDGGMFNELLLAHLQGNGVDDRFALAPFQASLNNLKLRRINHERTLGNIWLGHSNLDELLHCFHAIEHPIVHIDVNNMSTVLNLLLCNVHGLAIVACHHEFLEFERACDVTTLPNIHKRKSDFIYSALNHKRLKSTEPHDRFPLRWQGSGRQIFAGLCDGSNMSWR
mmetsp:Transcript_7433/g.12935  ORF Transcript_7433/g.12935 Transcript_7433/m.12935 type:complete len:281 (+) Transcript_7433:994-1836(+)